MRTVFKVGYLFLICGLFSSLAFAGRKPKAELSIDPITGGAPLQVQFDGSLSYDPDGTAIQKYRFDFGDGTPVVESVIPYVSHNYTRVGNFHAKLTVIDGDNEVSSPVGQIIRVFQANRPPVAKIKATPESGRPPLLVQFSGDESFDPDGTITHYKWRFPDGTVTNGVTSSFTFYETGTVTLTVTDNRNVRTDATFTVVIQTDSTTPNLAVTPADGVQITTPYPQFEITYSDADSGVDLTSLKVMVDGQDVSSRLQVAEDKAYLNFTQTYPLIQGTHDFIFELKDNAGNLSRFTNSYYVKLGQISTFYLSGYVKDEEGNPLAGVSVEEIFSPPSINVDVATDENGKFKIPFSLTGEYRLSFNKVGFTESVRSITPTEVMDTSMGTIYLASADPVTTLITSVSGGTAVNSTNSLTLDVPPNVLPFDVNFNIKEYTSQDTIPGPLPTLSAFTYAFALSPDGVSWGPGSGITLQLEDRLGFPIGTEIVYGIFNRELGRWLDSGISLTVGEAKAGVMILNPENTERGDPNQPSVCTGPNCVPPDSTSSAVGGAAGGGAGSAAGGSSGGGDGGSEGGSQGGTDGGCPDSVSGCDINLITGDLGIDHHLPSILSAGAVRSLHLNYQSTKANPHFTASIRSTWRLFTQKPDSVKATIRYPGSTSVSERVPSSTSTVEYFSILKPAKNDEGEYFKTGLYSFDSTTSFSYSDSEYATATFFGAPPGTRLGVLSRVPVTFESKVYDTTAIINRRLSPFGSGWGLQGLDAIHESQMGDVLWENGHKQSFKFKKINATSNLVSQKFSDETKGIDQTDITSLMVHDGIIYATDCYNHVVWRLNPAGTYEIIAGSGEAGFEGDGGSAVEAKLNCPVAIAFAEKGGFYIADRDNNRIRHVKDGKISTLVHYPEGKPLSVSEDKMRSVFFTTSTEVKMFNPRGVLETYAASSSGYLSQELNNPSQVLFDDFDYPIVVDKNNGRIFTIYPQARKVLETFNNSSTKAKIGKTLKPKSVVFDPVSKRFYLLAADGELYLWEGKGDRTLTKIHFDGTEFTSSTYKKTVAKKIQAISFSPETGLVASSENRIFFNRAYRNKRATPGQINYINMPGSFDQLVKEVDGTFTLTSPNKIVKKFDTDGKIIAILSPDSKNTIFHYNLSRQVQKIDFPAGAHFEFFYDGRGYLSSIKDSANRETHFEIDDEGRLLRINSPDGSFKEFNYNSDHMLTLEKDAEGKITTFNFQNGQIVKETLPGNRERQFYSVLGQGQTEVHISDTFVVRADSRSGDCFTEFMLNSSGGMTGRKNCMDEVFSFQLDSNQLPLVETRPNGQQIHREFDAVGRLTKQTDGSGVKLKTYDPVWSKVATVRDSLNNETQFSYNNFGLLSSIKDQASFETEIGYDEFGNLLFIKDAQSNVTSFETDDAQNLNSVSDPLNNRTEFDRDLAGNITSIKDAQNRVTHLTYDTFNRLTQITDALNHQTLFTYTGGGQLASLTDARGSTTSFDLDPISHKTSKVTNELSQSEEFFYNNNEDLVRKKNFDGSDIHYTRDLAGRISRVQTTSVDNNFTFDKSGIVKTASTLESNVEIEIDSHSRINSTTQFPVDAQVTYAYNSRGLKSGMNLYASNGLKVLGVTYFYNERKLPSKIVATIGASTLTWEQFYDELGRPILELLPNGLKVERAYDAAGRLILHSNEDSSDKPLSRFAYSYNAAGTISEIIKTFTDLRQPSIGRTVQSYSYDQLDRLTYASTDGMFVYDQLGNQLQNGGQYNAINQLNEDGNFTYAYTLNGNLATKVSKHTGEITQYIWNSQNQLLSVEVRSQLNLLLRSAYFKYDAFNRRIEKNSSGEITRYVFDGENVIAEVGANGSIKALYLHGPGIDNPIAMGRDLSGNGEISESELFFYTKDHLNSIQELTDKGQKIIQRYSYKAYGETKVLKTDRQQSFIENPYAYTSREWLQETGDYYYRWRNYDPSIGRWLSKDPILFAGGDTNLYGYVMQDPINLIDPSGLSATLYLALPYHAVIGVTNPNSSTGMTYGHFYPAGNSIGLFSPTAGKVGITNSYPGLIPLRTYNTTPAQDQQILQNMYNLRDMAKNGSYPYSAAPPFTGTMTGQDSNNCFGFASKACGGACQ